MNFFSYFKSKPEPLQASHNDIESFEFIEINSTLPINIHESNPTNKEQNPINIDTNKNPTPTNKEIEIPDRNESSMVDITIPDTYSISPPLRHRVFIEQPIEYESFPNSNYNSFSPKNSEEFTDMDLAIQSIIHLILGKDVVDRIAAHHRPTMGIL